MTINEVLPTILYILGAILLVALIVLTIKLTITTDKINELVDNITVKAKTLDETFTLIGSVTGKVTTITDRVINSIVSLIEKIFRGKGDK